MTEADKKEILVGIDCCKVVLRIVAKALDAIQQQMKGVETHQSTDDEFDDWSDEIEAIIDMLEQRMAWHENNKLDQLKDVLNR